MAHEIPDDMLDLRRVLLGAQLLSWRDALYMPPRRNPT
jgi:hypothetical protein